MNFKEFKRIVKAHEDLIDLVLGYVRYTNGIELRDEEDFSDLTDGVLDLLLKCNGESDE